MRRLPDRLTRVVLLAYPRAFRQRFGAELADALQVAWSAPSRGSAAAHRLRLLAATVSHGLAERAAAVARVVAWRSHRTHLYAPSGRHAGMCDAVLHDLRAAVRSLAAARGFTALAVFALALGIGANGAIFSVVRSVLLKPLPYRDAGRLVMLWSENPQLNGGANAVSPANFADLRDMSRSFSGLEYALSFVVSTAMAGHEDQGMLFVTRVGARMLEVLGTTAQIGRVFGAGERGVAVLSDAAWRARFGADPSVVGRHITLAGNEALEIVGVASPAFTFPYRSMLGPAGAATPTTTDLWVPMPLEGPRWVDASGQLVRSAHVLVAVGRLAPGVTLEQANADVAAQAAVLASRYPDTNRGWGARVADLHEQTVGGVRPALLLLLGGVAVLLLMAMVNVANLMLARSLVRQRELAVRAALGASSTQLVRQVLAESLLLAVTGAAVSMVAVRWVVGALVRLAPASLPRVAEVAPDATVVAAAAILAVVVGALVGLVPMWAAARPDVRTVLQDASRGASGTSSSGRRLRAALVVSQVALAAVLAVQAGLLTRSFAAVLDVDPGFRADHLLTFQMGAPDRLRGSDERAAFYQEFFARLRGLPGVVAAGGTTRIPLGSPNVTVSLRVEGRAVHPSQQPEAEYRRAMHDYFAAMRIPLRRGRAFTDADGPGAPPVAVINETLAARVFPGEDPIGKRLAVGTDADAPWLTVVGVIGDVRHGSLELPPAAEIYLNYLSNPPNGPFVVVRTAGDPAALATSVRQMARTIDSTLTLFDVRTMESVRRASVGERRFTLVLVVAFGVVALLLAAVGVYGVVALVVTERTSELGLRVALGANPIAVGRLVVGEALRVTVVGLGAGLLVGAGVARLIDMQLFGVAALDPITFVTVPIALVAAATAAAVAPAARAMRLDPMHALRAD